MTEVGVQPEVKVEMNSVDSILSTVQRTRLVTLLPTRRFVKGRPG